MLGSLTLYRRLLLENVFSRPSIRQYTPFGGRQDLTVLPSFGHGIAGIMAGTTVSFIAAPVEHIKARLQVQYAADKTKRMYSGPIDCLVKMVCAISCRESNVLTYRSSARMALQVFTVDFGPLSFSDPSFSSGGAPTMFLLESSKRRQACLLPPLTSGLAASPHSASGSLLTPQTL